MSWEQIVLFKKSILESGHQAEATPPCGALLNPVPAFIQNPHLAMDGDGGGEPRWNTGPSSLGPNEMQKEEENEKGYQDREGCDHPLIQGD